MNAMDNGKGSKPAFEERVGSVRVSIWKNKDKNGKPFYNTTLVRRFKAGEEWDNSNSYTGLSDLALLQEATTLAQGFLRSELLETTEDK
jgi:hypothetical protein